LHRLEAEVLFDALNSPSPAVVAAAASVIEDPVVREALADAYCVWVTAGPDILVLCSLSTPGGMAGHLFDPPEYTELSAPEIVRQSLECAADICIYTNKNITIEELS